MRLLTKNYATDNATTISASSSNAYFPSSNLSSPLRSSRWRSGGHYVVTASNNKIDFEEASGAQLTATLLPGTYSRAQLLIEIKAALEFTGANTYSVSFSSTSGRFTISSNGAYFALLNLSGTNALTNFCYLILGFSASDRTGALSYTGSNIAIHTEEHVTFDIKTTEEVDSVVILWPKDTGVRLSPNAQVFIQANATANFSTPAVSEELTVSDVYDIASHYFTSSHSYRYWRVLVIDPENAYLNVELGTVWIGPRIAFRDPENGFTPVITDNSEVVRTKYGQKYVDEYPQTMSLEINFSVLDYDIYKILEYAFRQNGVRTPIFITLDETGGVFDKDHFAIYGNLPAEFASEHLVASYFNGSITIEELG